MSDRGFDDDDGSSRRQRSSSRSPICFEYDDADGETHRVRVDPSLDPADPGWINEVERDAREFDAALPELRLPGTGEQYDDCGDDLPVVFCSDCMEREWAGRTCRRSACPRCKESWAFHTANTDAAKSDALRRKRNVSENTNKNKQHHTVFSASKSLRFDSNSPLNRAKELVKILAGGVDLDAGSIYYHPWRIKQEYRGDVAGHASGNGDLTWADILNKLDSDAWSWKAVKHEFLVYAPHFHLIGTSRWVQGGAVTDEISQQTGFVIHRITKRESSVSIYDEEDLCRATAYCRTHTGIQWDGDNEEFNAAAWRYGETANLVPSEKVSERIESIMREVSLDVLGVDFGRSNVCSEPVPVSQSPSNLPDERVKNEREQVSPAPVSSSGSSTTPLDDRSLDPSTTEVQLSGRLIADGGSTWEETAGISPAFLDDPAEAGAPSEDQETETERCGGEIVPMKYAPMYFDDDDLCEAIPERVAELEEDYRIWQNGGGPPPD